MTRHALASDYLRKRVEAIRARKEEKRKDPRARWLGADLAAVEVVTARRAGKKIRPRDIPGQIVFAWKESL